MARSLNAHQIPKGWQYELLDKLAGCYGESLQFDELALLGSIAHITVSDKTQDTATCELEIF